MEVGFNHINRPCPTAAVVYFWWTNERTKEFSPPPVLFACEQVSGGGSSSLQFESRRIARHNSIRRSLIHTVIEMRRLDQSLSMLLNTILNKILEGKNTCYSSKHLDVGIGHVTDFLCNHRSTLRCKPRPAGYRDGYSGYHGL